MTGRFNTSGLAFERLEDGSVRITRAEGPAVGSPEPEVLATLDHGSWCSVVAHVSPYGDGAEPFAHMSAFHDGRVQFAQAPAPAAESEQRDPGDETPSA